MRRNMDEPTEWRAWGMYAISKEGYMKLTSYIPCGKPVGTYLIPRTVGSRYPRYRTTKKGNLQTHRISALLKKVWGISQEMPLEVAEVMRENAARWNRTSNNKRPDWRKSPCAAPDFPGPPRIFNLTRIIWTPMIPLYNRTIHRSTPFPIGGSYAQTSPSQSAYRERPGAQRGDQDQRNYAE